VEDFFIKLLNLFLKSIKNFPQSLLISDEVLCFDGKFLNHRFNEVVNGAHCNFGDRDLMKIMKRKNLN